MIIPEFLHEFDCFIHLLFLEVERVHQDDQICDNSTQGEGVFIILPSFLEGFIDSTTLNKNTYKPEHVVREVVHAGAQVGEDRQ